jgi:hypothetical protein
LLCDGFLQMGLAYAVEAADNERTRQSAKCFMVVAPRFG